MNEKQYDEHEDEIDLKELFMALWKRKVMIISITLIVAIIAGLVSMFVLTPVYETKLNLVISMPATYATKYGDYTMPITTNDQYIDLITSNNVIVNTITDMGYDTEKVTVEKLRKNITIESNKDAKAAGVIQNSFNVTVKAKTSAESHKLAETLFNNYIKFMDAMTKERAVGFFYDRFSIGVQSVTVSLNSAKEILVKNETLIKDIPETINQNQAMQNVQGKDPDTFNYVVLEDIINANYKKVELDIITNKQSIADLENTLSVYNQHIEELDREKKAIAKYYETGTVSRLESTIMDAVDTNIYMPSSPVAASQKSSPSNTLNVAIGIVIGGMIGVITALVQQYWFKKS